MNYGSPQQNNNSNNNYGGPTFAEGAGAFGGGMAGLLSLLGIGHGQNPSDAANNYLNQIPGQTKPYYQPYMDTGGKALNDYYNKMGQNPTDVYNNLGKGYKESPGYKFQLQQAMNAGNSANAAGGMLGTPQHQQQNMELAQDVASKDYENYMNHVLGLNTEQTKGLGDLTHIGQNSSQQYSDIIGSVLGKQGQNAWETTKGQNESSQQNWSNLFKMIPFLGSLFGGKQHDNLV